MNRLLRYPLRRQPAPAARLFCFAHAGGGSMSFRPWLLASGPELEVVAVELPGHGDRLVEPAHRDITGLSDAVTAALVEHLDRPYALYGHSTGAGVALTVAQRLTGMAGVRSPSSLVVGACTAPGQPADPAWSVRSDCTDAELVDWMRRAGGTSDEVLASPGLLDLIMPTLRADIELLESWRRTHRSLRLPLPIRAISGSRDPMAPARAMAGWAAQTGADFDQHTVDAGHFFIPEAFDLVSRLVREDVRAARPAAVPTGRREA